jgi:hypothetical protein
MKKPEIRLDERHHTRISCDKKEARQICNFFRDRGFLCIQSEVLFRFSITEGTKEVVRSEVVDLIFPSSIDPGEIGAALKEYLARQTRPDDLEDSLPARLT